MIGFLSGTVLLTEGGELLVEVGGVGYRVQVPERVMAKTAVGDVITLWTRQIVRDDAIELVGFLDETDARFFDSLTRVNKVGPKAALSVLSLGDAREVQSNILQGNFEYIASAKGIGKKTAERIVLELKGGLEDILDHQQDVVRDQQVVEALVALGYSQREAAQAAASVDRSLKPEERIREALRSMKA